jgi:hypothetical protein
MGLFGKSFFVSAMKPARAPRVARLEHHHVVLEPDDHRVVAAGPVVRR